MCYGFLPGSSDTLLLSVVLSVVFFFFILEGLATVIARPRTVCELFFYLDVVATLSLIAVRMLTPAPPSLRCGEALTARAAAQDILWIQEAIAGDASEELTLTRSARLARVGARVARLALFAGPDDRCDHVHVDMIACDHMRSRITCDHRVSTAKGIKKRMDKHQSRIARMCVHTGPLWRCKMRCTCFNWQLPFAAVGSWCTHPCPTGP